MGVGAGSYGGVELLVIVVFGHETLGLGALYVPPQTLDFLFHFGMFTALAYPLEVGLYLAFELEAVAS